jgi:lysophospholipase L1-like esterase
LADNQKINELNALLIDEYEGNLPVFDLAKFESTLPNGKRQMFSHKSEKYFSLVPEYTDDNGHLNEKGRKIVAEQLLIFLANLVDE